MQFQILNCILIVSLSTIAAQESDALEWNTNNVLEDEIFGDGLARAIAGPTSCGLLGNYSGVTCVTETKYRVPDSSMLYSCPYGYVCVDNPYVCLQDALPACRFEKRCGECRANATNVCISLKEYSACVNGQLDGNRKYCQASKPYCTMLYDDNGILHHECSNVIENGCDISVPEPTTPPPPKPFECISYGKFPDITDPTCKTYIYCYNDNGKMAELKYICVKDLVFNSIKGKCVNPDSFQCLR